ncbi:MAG: Nitrilotriacetate monooxygenase component B, partial [uncultured Frankineae bacterium]
AAPRLRPLRPRARGLPAAQQRGGAAADRVGDHAQPGGRRQPRAALVLHHLLGAAARRAVHLRRRQGLPAQRGRDGRVRREPVPGGARRPGQPHRHRLPAGRQRVRRHRPDPRAQRARRAAARGRVAGRAGVSRGRHARVQWRLDRGVRRGGVDRDRRPGAARRAPRDLAAPAARPPRGRRVEHDRRGQLPTAHPVRRAERPGV